MSTSRRPATTTEKSDKKKTICGACQSELEPDHGGIQCIQAHHFCVECSQTIVNLVLGDPHQYLPLRCIQCHVDLNPSVFERQLTPAQVEFYNQNMLVLVWAKALLGDGERLDNCPFCSFAVIRGVYDPNILHCERPECGKTSCLICRKACPNFLNNYATEEEELEMIRHTICDTLAFEKQRFDETIEAGQKLACPKCGLSGMKDESCTHMTCPTCGQIWCYFCGKAVEQCDKARGGSDTIFEHNHNWDKNPNRCPMYLTQIQDVDPRWPDNDQQCLDMFHRIRSIRLLRELYKELGKERIDALNDHFHSMDSCGFTLDEILHADLTLIQGGRRN